MRDRRQRAMAERTDSIDARDARRIGLVSDSHGPIDPRIVQALGDCDVVVHAGDIGGPDVLAAFDTTVTVAVYGNNDTRQRWGGVDVELPESVRIDVRGGSLAVIHGHQFPRAKQRHAKLRERYSDVAIVVYGHSHRRCIDDATLPWVINPGACGRARTFGGASAVLLDWRGGQWGVAELTVG